MSNSIDECKQKYLELCKKGERTHRSISGSLQDKFKGVSFSMVRDQLIRDGYIEEVGVIKKNFLNYVRTQPIYKTTSKKFKKTNEIEVVIPEHWEDGTRRSIGNAFDWRNSDQMLFSKTEISAFNANYKPGKSLVIRDPIGQYLKA